MVIDWSVLARQLLLVFVPVLTSRGIVPDYLAGPIVDLATYLLGTVLVAFVIWLGQRREKPAIKIEEVAQLPEVKKIEVADFKLAAEVPSRKVTM